MTNVPRGSLEERGPARRRLTRAEQQARTRERLIGAAAQVFADKGFGAASIEEICTTAGYSRGAFYANFSDKHELLGEMLAARDQRDRASLAQLVQRDHQGVETPAGPSDVGAWLAGMVADEAHVLALRLELLSHALRDAEFGDRVRDAQRSEADATLELLHQVSTTIPARSSLDDESTVRLVLALVDGLTLRKAIDPELDVAAACSDLVSLLTEVTHGA